MELLKAELHYYLREHLWHHAIELCNNELKAGRDAYISFWKSFALSQENSLIDSIREIELLDGYQEFYYSSTYALLAYHQMYPNPDNAKIDELQQRLMSFSNITQEDLLHSLRLACYLNDNEKYAEIEDKLNQLESNETQEELIIKGWHKVKENNSNEWKMAQKMFEKCVKNFGNDNLDSILGGLKAVERLKSYEDLLDTYKEVIKLNSKFIPLYIERLKIYLLKNDYEAAVDYIQRKLSKEKNFEILKILAVSKLMSEGDFKEVSKILNEMWDLIIAKEPKNPELYYNNCCLFRKLCDHKKEILCICEKMIDRALELNPNNSYYLTEKAYLRIFDGEIGEAKSIFSRASEIDPNNKDCSIGVLYCKILEEKYDEVTEETKFLREMNEQGNQKNSYKLSLFDAICLSNSNAREETIVSTIKDSLKTYIESSKLLNPWNKYEALIFMEYDSLYEMAFTLLKRYSFDKRYEAGSSTEALNQAKRILSLLKKNKYMISSHLLNAKLMFILNDNSSAFAEVNTALEVDKSNLEALMLKVKFYYEQKDYSKAKEILNDAMITNYNTCKEDAHFMIIKCNCELALNEIENAQKSLNIAISVFDKCLNEKNSKK